ncbi:MAG: sporulation protein YabP [Bacilli bacterium]|nr:sporulation protein YabP [Bacilli bacterium]
MENNSLHFEHTPYHNVFLKDRKSIELTGVKRIESFDSFEFLIETSLGYLNITGSDLTLIRLDQDQNEVSIKGNIDSISYVSDKKKSQQKEKMFNKLLK